MKWFFIGGLLLSFTAFSQERTDAFLVDLLAKSSDSLLKAVLKNPEEYRYQIIYTQINCDKNNKPAFKNYYYNVDPHRYFNPASVVKLPLAFLSLEKLTEMKQPGVDKFSFMRFDSGWHKQTVLYRDSTAQYELPSIAQFIRKAFLISDNDAYNRMYEFVGQQRTNRRMWEMGYKDTRITRRFMRMTAEENRHTNPISFIDRNGRVIYQQPSQYNTDSFDFSRTYKMGKAHLNANDSLINEPIDFTRSNNYPLEDMYMTLRSVLFPQSVKPSQRFRLSDEDYQFLYRFLSQYPSETDYPLYDTASFYDSYVKFFFREGNHSMPSSVRVFNKVGWAYGCLTDVSYVVDFENKTEFMLAATVYVNKDGVLNDDKYEYESVGWPFLYQLGQAIYQYELKRPKRFPPDLSDFRLRYERRKDDGRKPVKEVDN